MSTADLAPSQTIHHRIVQILDELPAIGKDQKNAQQGFMFRGHDDILNALNPLLAKHGVFVVPDVLDRVTAQRQTKSGSVMYEVNLHVGFTFYGVEGDHVSASAWGEGTDSGDKATNKAMTMAFKNVLNQTFAISSEEFKDADAETPEPTQGRRAPAATEKKATKGQLNEITLAVKLLQDSYPDAAGPGKKWREIANAYAAEKLGRADGTEYTAKQASDLREWLEQKFRQLSSEDIPFGEAA